MIHSTAGGNLKDYGFYDIAKVRLLEEGEAVYVISEIKDLKVEDIVLIPYQNVKVKARVERIDKKVHEQNFPIPIKRLKKIIRICE